MGLFLVPVLVPFYRVIGGYLVPIGARAKQEGKLWKPASDGLIALPCRLARDLSTRLPCALGNRVLRATLSPPV